MNSEDLLAGVQRETDEALAAAPKEARRMKCQTCQKKRRCKAHPSGLVSIPLLWICRECWFYAMELK
jgi:hypothetical protein